MDELELILCSPSNPSQRTSIFYQLNSSPIARKYFACVREAVNAKRPFWESDRFYNFPHDYRNLIWIANQIRRAIEYINSYRPETVEPLASAELSQEKLNKLHKVFEDLRGSVAAPTQFYQNAPGPVQQAVLELNLNVHRYEDFIFNERKVKAGRGPAAKIILTYDSTLPRYPLGEEDYAHFTTVCTFGAWYVNYRELGKQLWDVYKDRDEEIGEENIRPMRFYSAEGLLEFSQTTPPEWASKELERFWQWWDTKAEQLSHLGFRKFDPRNAISFLPVAQLNREKGAVKGMSDAEIIDHIGHHQFAVELKVSS